MTDDDIADLTRRVGAIQALLRHRVEATAHAAVLDAWSNEFVDAAIRVPGSEPMAMKLSTAMVRERVAQRRAAINDELARLCGPLSTPDTKEPT